MIFVVLSLLVIVSGVYLIIRTTDTVVVPYCQGDVCLEEARVYKDVTDKTKCLLIGGKYEKKSNGWGGYNIYCLVR